MRFSINKKEKIMILIFGILLYAFIFFRFVWLAAVPEITAQKDELSKLQTEKAGLDRDILNIDSLKAGLTEKRLGNERLGQYLMDSANIKDSLEYVEKLALLLGKEIKGINVSKPVGVPVSGGTEGDAKGNYYEFQISFNTSMNYYEVIDLVKYIEGGTKKVKINKLSLTADNSNKTAGAAANASQGAKTGMASTAQDANAGAAAGVGVSAGSDAGTGITNGGSAGMVPAEDNTELTAAAVFDVNMSVSFYSLNISSLNNIYEFSRNKFHNYDKGNPNPYILPETDSMGNLLPRADGLQKNGTPSASFPSKDNADLAISGNSFLKAGENFAIVGKDSSRSILRLTTKERVSLNISLNGLSYTVKAVEGNGKQSAFTGSLADRDFNIHVSMDIPFIMENENIGLDINILNNTGRNVNIMLSDKNKRAVIKNRQGKVIQAKDADERVIIV